jgi:hypothetical protein
MRKVLVVLLALAIAGGLFAQGFSLTGYFDGGIGLFIPDAGDPGLALVTRDSDVGGGMRAQINAAYTNEAKNAGINLRIRANGDEFGKGGNNLNAFFPYAYGWISPFEGKLTVKGGKVDDGTFGTGDALVDDDLGERGGFLAIVKPVDLLSLGFGAYANDPFAATGMSGLDAAKYTAGAVINVPDILKVTLQYANRGDAGDPEAERIWAAFNILAASKIGLKFVVAGKVEQLQNFSDAGTIGIYETIGFTKVQNLSLNLNLWQILAKKDNDPLTADDDFSLRVWFWASYALAEGKIVPRFDVNFLTAGSVNTAVLHFNNRFAPGTITSGVNAGKPGGRNDASWKIDKDTQIFNLRPSVGFYLDKNSWFELGYNLDLGLGKGTGDFVNHAIYADLKVSF